MRTLLKTLFLTAMLVSGKAVWANPQADARLIAERDFGAHQKANAERSLKEALVAVYFKPISDVGVQIADVDKFIALVPDEDIAPYLERMLSESAAVYLSQLSHEQLASIAVALRADEDATWSGILAEELEQKRIRALEKTLADLNATGSDDTKAAELAEFDVGIKSVNSALKDERVKIIAEAAATVFRMTLHYSQEIEQLEKPANNPVTLSALKTNGVLRVANPVQRKSLIRQLSGSESGGGIQFRKPPSEKMQTN